MSDVNFQPGCTSVGSVIICGPGGVAIRDRRRCIECERPQARMVLREPNSPWYGGDFFCECGDVYMDGERCQRPFERGWRKRAQERFERMWAEALPEGTVALRDWSNDGSGWLSGVRLPDGTEVAR
jgi:hypothetical protein